jgi:hypothetical protein
MDSIQLSMRERLE